MDKETKTEETNAPEFDGGLNFSKKLVVRVFYISIIVAGLGITGFLFYKEYTKPQVIGGEVEPTKIETPEIKNYSNDYWGFKFQYPGSWTPVVSSFEDGDYYFTSQNVNFLSEVEEGEAIVEVKTYNNWKNLSFQDWLLDQQTNYPPQGKISNQKNITFHGVPAIDYIIELKKPVNNTKYWEILAISKNDHIKYLFILETANKEDNLKYSEKFQEIKDTLEFYLGFGQN